MKTTTLAMPTPWEIDRNPELVALYLLFESLEVTSRSIIAAHPDLLNAEQLRPESLSRDTKAAMLLLESLDRLAQQILQYKRSVSAPQKSKPARTTDTSRKQKQHPDLQQLILPFFTL